MEKTKNWQEPQRCELVREFLYGSDISALSRIPDHISDKAVQEHIAIIYGMVMTQQDIRFWRTLC